MFLDIRAPVLYSSRAGWYLSLPIVVRDSTYRIESFHECTWAGSSSVIGLRTCSSLAPWHLPHAHHYCLVIVPSLSASQTIFLSSFQQAVSLQCCTLDLLPKKAYCLYCTNAAGILKNFLVSDRRITPHLMKCDGHLPYIK